MNENDFELLCESIRQAGEIRRGVRKPSRTFIIEDPDPKAIRERLGLSQSRFASIIGVSVRTLQNWEQGRREPEGPAKALLRVVDREPQAGITCTTQQLKSEGQQGVALNTCPAASSNMS